MKVLSGIDRVFFSSVTDQPLFDGNSGSVGFITENEGEYTREIKTIKLANGQDLTTCSEYKFKFETADSAKFDSIRNISDNGTKVALVAYAENGGCLTWFYPSQIFYKDVLDQKSGELKKLQVTISATGTNELPINYGNNLIPPYIANGERIAETILTACTASSTTKNVTFTAGVGNVIQMVSTTGSDGSLGFTFNFPVEPTMTQGFYALVDNWVYGSISLIIYDADGITLASDTFYASDSNEELEASVTPFELTGASYMELKLGVATGTTAQFDNLKLSYGINPPKMD